MNTYIITIIYINFATNKFYKMENDKSEILREELGDLTINHQPTRYAVYKAMERYANLRLDAVGIPLPVEEIKKAINLFKEEELPNAESPFHYEAEIWSGMKHFIEWLETKKQ